MTKATSDEIVRIDSNPPNWPKWKRILGIFPSREIPEPKPDETEDEGEAETDAEDQEDQPQNEPETSDEIDEIDEAESPWQNFVAKLIPLDDCDNREFDSWRDFVTSANNDTLYAWKTHRSSHETGSESIKRNLTDNWRGTETWDRCIEMALKTGWPEGRQMLEESLAIVRPRSAMHKTLEFSVAGAYPMVPNYCAGDPECMVIDPGADFRTQKPIVRIDYNNMVPWTVPATALMLRGAAVLSFAETLERRGFSTEIRIVNNLKPGYSAKDRTKAFRCSYVFKRAGEPLDIDRAAFAIAHPSSFRRLMFAIIEQHAELESVEYGYPLHEPNDSDPNTIFIKGPSPHETAETARQAVADAAENLLNELQISEENGD